MYAKFCVTRETASSFIRIFVNRRAYSIQSSRPLPNGSFPYYLARDEHTKKPRPLDEGAIRMHLNGDITIACTQSTRRHNARNGLRSTPISTAPSKPCFKCNGN